MIRSGAACLEPLEAAHPLEDPQAARLDVVAAHLLAREPRALEHRHVDALPCEVPGERAAGGPAADHDHVRLRRPRGHGCGGGGRRGGPGARRCCVASSSASAASRSRYASASGSGAAELLGDPRERPRAGVAEEERGAGPPHRDRRGEREDPVDDVLLAAAAEGRGAADVGDVVAAVVERAEQQPVLAQGVVTGPEPGADLEHAPGVGAGDRAPVLDAERLAAQAPLEALGGAEPLHELGQEPHAVGVRGDELRAGEADVARGHERRQEPVAAVQRQLAAAVARAVEDVVDDQRDVVEQLDRGGRPEHARRDGLRRRRVVAREDGHRAEVLRPRRQLTPHHVPDLGVAVVDPGGDDACAGGRGRR